MADKD
ncbi:uncharacterized protein FFB14_10466 [Fusarium fujikuroi]